MIAKIRHHLSTGIGIFARFLAKWKIIWPWSIIVSRHLISIEPRKSNPKNLRIFALSPNRFMADLKILAAKDGYEVITLRAPWQGVVSSLFAGRRGKKTDGILLAGKFEESMQNFLTAR